MAIIMIPYDVTAAAIGGNVDTNIRSKNCDIIFILLLPAVDVDVDIVVVTID